MHSRPLYLVALLLTTVPAVQASDSVPCRIFHLQLRQCVYLHRQAVGQRDGALLLPGAVFMRPSWGGSAAGIRLSTKEVGGICMNM